MALSTIQSFEDSAAMKLVLDTHSPDADHKVNVTPLLSIIDKILLRATPSIDSALTGTNENGQMKDESNGAASSASLGELPYVINKVFCELTCNCSSDAHTKTMAILETLSKYSWDTKAVLTIAAFAVNFGEFALFAQLYFSNPLAKYISLLKPLPEIIEHGQSLKPQFDAITMLLKAVVVLTKCIVGFNDLNPKYVSPDKPPMSSAMGEIYKPVYWIILGVVACATQIATLTGSTDGQAPTFSISTLALRINNKLKILQEQFDICQTFIVEEQHKEDYQKIVNVFEVPQLDNILNTICNLDHSSTHILVDSCGQKVEIEVFLQKPVLILVSNVDITLQEITALGNIYSEGKKNPNTQYNILWIPIVDTTITRWENEKQKFDELRTQMPWYTVKEPWSIKPVVIEYIKQEWKYSGKVSLVALDSKGKVQSLNALHMIWTWGNSAFPFTDSQLPSFLPQSSFLDLIFGGIDSIIDNVIKKEGVTVCFYGGGDTEWIKKFTSVVKETAEIVGITIELVYVGKSTVVEQVKKNISFINSELKIGQCLSEASMWLFWTRVKSILYSKTIRFSSTVTSTEIMEEVITLLSYDGADKGWSIFCKGSSTAKAIGDVEVILGDLSKNVEWANSDKVKTDFVIELDIHFKKVLSSKHCNRVFLNGEIEGDVHCYCGRAMQKSFVYCCCKND